jgi:hypothetical protein
MAQIFKNCLSQLVKNYLSQLVKNCLSQLFKNCTSQLVKNCMSHLASQDRPACISRRLSVPQYICVCACVQFLQCRNICTIYWGVILPVENKTRIYCMLSVIVCIPLPYIACRFTNRHAALHTAHADLLTWIACRLVLVTAGLFIAHGAVNFSICWS